MKEFDAISHLVSIEQKAASLLLDAQVEADRRVSESRTQQENEFKSLYEDIVQQNEQMYAKQKNIISTEFEQTLQNYKKEVQSIPLNFERFNTLLNNQLFKQ